MRGGVGWGGRGGGGGRGGSRRGRPPPPFRGSRTRGGRRPQSSGGSRDPPAAPPAQPTTVAPGSLPAGEPRPPVVGPAEAAVLAFPSASRTRRVAGRLPASFLLPKRHSPSTTSANEPPHLTIP